MPSLPTRTTTPSPPRLRLARWALAVVLTGAAACTPTIDYRGYLPPQNALQQLQPGMSKAEVEALLGSPSTTATINFSGDSYYYISSVVETRAFLEPQEIDRTVVAIRFNQTDQVESFAHYGLEDGRIIDFSTRTTPTRGKELTILQQIFSNIGRFNPANPGG
jgi:outer membrane protein assembly factor BamE (lipoprotein component of BamABCDE complex)